MAFWPVYEFVQPLLDAAGDYPMVGTPAWCALDDDDDRKIAAVLDGGCHHALRLELNQEALAEASKDISASEDWKAVAQELLQLRAFRQKNTWVKRVAS